MIITEPTQEEDHNHDEFNRLLELQAIEEDDASEHEESAGDIPVIESEEIQSAIEEEDALEDAEVIDGILPIANISYILFDESNTEQNVNTLASTCSLCHFSS